MGVDKLIDLHVNGSRRDSGIHCYSLMIKHISVSKGQDQFPPSRKTRRRSIFRKKVVVQKSSKYTIGKAKLDLQVVMGHGVVVWSWIGVLREH